MKKILLIAMTTLSFAGCYSTGHLAPPPVAMVTWTGTALSYPISWMLEDE
tara:strand:+ start:1853 stop:2002 length:150 start_codon:yes stop_codon:yes gene_type:complete